MDAFWESGLGEITGSIEDAFAKTFKQIPDGTLALAKIDSFVNAEYQGSKYLSIDWQLTDGDFKGQKVNQKLKVFGEDKVRHRALNMLKLIYLLYKVQPMHSNPPTDQDLYIFVGKHAGIKIRETEPNDEGKQYNWVSEVHAAAGFKCETGVKLIVTHKNIMPDTYETALNRNANRTYGHATEDIPF